MARASKSRGDTPTALDTAFAIDLAYSAGAIIRSDFKSAINARLKSDGSPVTDTDIKINKMVVEIIRKSYPSHDILSEEGSYLSNRSSHRWVADPLDGTIAFLNGSPTSVFSLALVINGRPHIGVVYDPFMDRMFHASRENGAFLNNERIEVSTNSKLEGAVIGISRWKNAQFDMEPLYKKLISKDVGANVLQLGSIAYMGALVSSGTFSANIHPARESFDSAALKVIVEEAKGKVTDVFGNDQNYNRRIKGCVMTNGIVHEELIKITRLLRSS